MIYPSIDKILNVVGSKYTLVHMASMRSKQIQEYEHYQLKEDEYVSKKELGRALEEIEKGLVTIVNK